MVTRIHMRIPSGTDEEFGNWKMTELVDLAVKNMVIFHSYVDSKGLHFFLCVFSSRLEDPKKMWLKTGARKL